MKKILLSGFISTLFSLDTSAMMDPSLEGKPQGALVTKVRRYSQLTSPQKGMLSAIPTQEKVELVYSSEALSFWTEAEAESYFCISKNLFQAQFFNVFSASEVNQVARKSFDANVSWSSRTLERFSFGFLSSPPFQEPERDVLRLLFWAGWYSLSDDREDLSLYRREINEVKHRLLAKKQPYFNDLVRYLRDSVLETLNCESFKRINGLSEKKSKVKELFSYVADDDKVVPSDDKSGTAVKSGGKNFSLEQYQPVFSKSEWTGLQQCSDETQKDALMIRIADMSGIAAMQVTELREQIQEKERTAQSVVRNLQRKMQEDRENAQEIVTNLQAQIKEQKEQLEVQKEETNAQKEKNRSLEERLTALEAANTKKEQEEVEKEQLQLASVQKQIQESKDPVEEKKQERSFASTGHRESGEFNFGRLKYSGEISKSGTYVEAEGKGEFSWLPFKIIGSFSHNRLDLSNAVVKFITLEIPFNCGGYFNMENIRRIGGETIDRQKKEITVNIKDGSKYIFSQNLIRFVTKDGEIRTYEVEK